METPTDPPTLRAALISADAWSVLPRGMPSNDAVMIGMKTSGSPMPVTTRVQAKNQKPRSLYVLVSRYIENAMIDAPAAIRYFGCALPDMIPTTNIMAKVTRPPGVSMIPAQVAV